MAKKKLDTNIVILGIAIVSMVVALAIIISMIPKNKEKVMKKVETEVTKTVKEPTAIAEPVEKSLLVTDFNGNEIDLSDLEGKVTIIDFWATWCPPCKAELPHFQELWDKYGGEDFNIVGIALDRGGERDVRPFLEKNGYTFPVALPTRDVIQHFGNPSSIPTTFIFDSKGELAEKIVGAREKAYWDSLIERLIAEKA